MTVCSRTSTAFFTAGLAAPTRRVRQAAAAFVLAECANIFDDAEAAKAAKVAVGGLVSKSVPFQGGAVVSTSGDAEKGPTGATAFALLAELMLIKATGDNTFEENREAWLRALLQLQRPAAGSGVRRGRVRIRLLQWETWLALAHYHRAFPNDTSVEAALKKADAYMINRYGQELNSHFAHWGLMTGSVRYLTDPERAV